MWILSPCVLVCIRQIYKHADGEIALRRNPRKLDAREHSVARSIAVDDCRKILRREFCLFRKRPSDTNGRFVCETHALFDLEPDIRPCTNSLFDFLKGRLRGQRRCRRRTANRAAFITITEQRLDGRDAGGLRLRITVGIDEVTVIVTDPGAVVGVVHIELDVPLGPAVIDHAVVHPEERIAR